MDAVILALVLCWGIPELVVRLGEPPLQAFRAIHFAGDLNSPRLFVTDPWLHWKLRPEVRLEFLGQTVETDADGFRNWPAAAEAEKSVVCLGDSTVFGWGVAQEEAFPRRLEEVLPDGAWRVINAGVPGYSSLQVRLQAERWIPRWKPEVVVICVGNNEAWPVAVSDQRLHDKRRVKATLVSILSQSRFFVWATERLRREEPQAFIATSLENTEPRVALSESEDNLGEVIRLARRHGARVIVVGPPANLYKPPMRIEQFVEWDAFMGYVNDFTRLLAGKRFEEAMAKVEASLAAEPDRFWYLWCRAAVLQEMGRSAAAREAFEDAFERHPYPERCRLSYRQMLRRLAGEHGVGFLDVNELFHEITAPEPPVGLYLDWCHPTSEGHLHIAEALAGMLR